MSDDGGRSSREVWLVMRVLEFRTHDRLLIPFGVYDDEAAATRASDDATKQAGELVRTTMVVKQRQTADKQIVAEPLMQLGDFLNQLGIKGVGHVVVPQEVHGTVVVAVPKLVVPTRH